MCGILDASSAHEVFGASRTPAGEDFLVWIDSEHGSMVVGGKQLEELRRAAASTYEEWAEEAVMDGRLRVENRARVDREADRLRISGDCKSNDEHVIALAIVSGARLLFSRDKELVSDFKNRSLFENSPELDRLSGRVLRGRVLPTGTTRNARRSRNQMLRSDDICQSKRCRRRR